MLPALKYRICVWVGVICVTVAAFLVIHFVLKYSCPTKNCTASPKIQMEIQHEQYLANVALNQAYTLRNQENTLQRQMNTEIKQTNILRQALGTDESYANNNMDACAKVYPGIVGELRSNLHAAYAESGVMKKLLSNANVQIQVMKNDTNQVITHIKKAKADLANANVVLSGYLTKKKESANVAAQINIANTTVGKLNSQFSNIQAKFSATLALQKQLENNYSTASNKLAATKKLYETSLELDKLAKEEATNALSQYQYAMKLDMVSVGSFNFTSTKLGMLGTLRSNTAASLTPGNWTQPSTVTVGSLTSGTDTVARTVTIQGGMKNFVKYLNPAVPCYKCKDDYGLGGCAYSPACGSCQNCQSGASVVAAPFTLGSILLPSGPDNHVNNIYSESVDQFIQNSTWTKTAIPPSGAFEVSIDVSSIPSGSGKMQVPSTVNSQGIGTASYSFQYSISPEMCFTGIFLTTAENPEWLTQIFNAAYNSPNVEDAGESGPSPAGNGPSMRLVNSGNRPFVTYDGWRYGRDYTTRSVKDPWETSNVAAGTQVYMCKGEYTKTVTSDGNVPCTPCKVPGSHPQVVVQSGVARHVQYADNCTADSCCTEFYNMNKASQISDKATYKPKKTNYTTVSYGPPPKNEAVCYSWNNKEWQTIKSSNGVGRSYPGGGQPGCANNATNINHTTACGCDKCVMCNSTLTAYSNVASYTPSSGYSIVEKKYHGMGPGYPNEGWYVPIGSNIAPQANVTVKTNCSAACPDLMKYYKRYNIWSTCRSANPYKWQSKCSSPIEGYEVGYLNPSCGAECGWADKFKYTGSGKGSNCILQSLNSFSQDNNSNDGNKKYTNYYGGKRYPKTVNLNSNRTVNFTMNKCAKSDVINITQKGQAVLFFGGTYDPSKSIFSVYMRHLVVGGQNNHPSTVMSHSGNSSYFKFIGNISVPSGDKVQLRIQQNLGNAVYVMAKTTSAPQWNPVAPGNIPINVPYYGGTSAEHVIPLGPLYAGPMVLTGVPHSINLTASYKSTTVAPEWTVNRNAFNSNNNPYVNYSDGCGVTPSSGKQLGYGGYGGTTFNSQCDSCTNVGGVLTCKNCGYYSSTQGIIARTVSTSINYKTMNCDGVELGSDAKLKCISRKKCNVLTCAAASVWGGSCVYNKYFNRPGGFMARANKYGNPTNIPCYTAINDANFTGKNLAGKTNVPWDIRYSYNCQSGLLKTAPNTPPGTSGLSKILYNNLKNKCSTDFLNKAQQNIFPIETDGGKTNWPAYNPCAYTTKEEAEKACTANPNCIAISNSSGISGASPNWVLWSGSSEANTTLDSTASTTCFKRTACGDEISFPSVSSVANPTHVSLYTSLNASNHPYMNIWGPMQGGGSSNGLYNLVDYRNGRTISVTQPATNAKGTFGEFQTGGYQHSMYFTVNVTQGKFTTGLPVYVAYSGGSPINIGWPAIVVPF